MGDSNAPDEFCRDYERSIETFASEDRQPLLEAHCVLFDGVTDLSLQLFVDDILKCQVMPTSLADDARREIARSNACLTRALDRGGYKQNEAKLEVIPKLLARSENRLIGSKGYVPHKVMWFLKHLGALLSASGTNGYEIKARVNAMSKHWFAFAGFWRAKRGS